MGISKMAAKSKNLSCIPEILAVRQDSTADTEVRSGHRSPSDVLSVYLQGGPRYRLGDHTFRFRPPMAILIPEGMLDQDMQKGKVEGIFVLFRGRGLIRKKRDSKSKVTVTLGSQRLVVPGLKQISDDDAERLAAALHEIGSVTDVGLVGKMRKASLLFQAVSYYCEAGGTVEGPGLHREAVRLRDLIKDRAFESAPLAKIYREIDISSAHAETLFRKAYGVTAVTYRKRLRLSKARELLVSSKLNVSQTAFAVGFTDALYFSRVFRKAFGATPSSLIRAFSGKRR